MRKPIFAACADVHLHPHPHGNTYDHQGRSSRVMLTIAALRTVLTLCQEMSIPLWILGDLLHDKHHVPVEVIGPLLDLRAEFFGTDVELLVGNHERPDRFSDVNTLAWLNDDTHWCVHDGVGMTRFAVPGLDVYTMPWFSDPEPACAKLRELVAAADPNHRRILLGHGCVDGALSDNGHRLSNPKLTPEKLWLPSFNFSLWGDIHKAQAIAPNAWYVGALHPQSFGERHNPAGFVVVYDDLTWERIEIVGGPVFEYVDTTEPVTPLHAGHFVKPSPEAVAAASLQSHPGMALDMDTTSLESMVAAYMAANPAPEQAGATVQSVTTAIKECLP